MHDSQKENKNNNKNGHRFIFFFVIQIVVSNKYINRI